MNTSWTTRWFRKPAPGVKVPWTTRWFRKRALVYHLLVCILVPGCLYAGWWQLHRAEQGNALSYLYTVEWPIFAILAAVGWWQLIHEDPAAVDSRKVERARRAAHRGPWIPPAPDADAGFVISSAERPALTTSSATGSGSGAPVLYDASGTPIAGLAPLDQASAAGPSRPVPQEPSPLDPRPAPGPADPVVATHGLSSYNAHLARLSATGARKSWRNPHGEVAGRKEPPAED